MRTGFLLSRSVDGRTHDPYNGMTMGVFTRENEVRGGGETETIIGSSVKIEGKFSGRGNMVIEGKVVGSVKTDGDIRITEGAALKASVEARSATVSGEIHGNIKIADHLQLTATARITGDVETKTITIESGAQLNGRCVMGVEPVREKASEREGNETASPKKRLTPSMEGVLKSARD